MSGPRPYNALGWYGVACTIAVYCSALHYLGRWLFRLIH